MPPLSVELTARVSGSLDLNSTQRAVTAEGLSENFLAKRCNITAGRFGTSPTRGGQQAYQTGVFVESCFRQMFWDLRRLNESLP